MVVSDEEGGQSLNEIQLPKELTSIATRINSHKNNIGYSFIEIGKELMRAKEEDTQHGEWQLFLDEINMSKSQADRHIKISKEHEIGKLPNVGKIGFSAMYEIATLPEEKRSKAINDDGTSKSVSEIRKMKRQLKESEQAKRQAETQAQAERKERERLERENESLASREPEIREVVIEDETKINELQSRLKSFQEKIDLLEREKNKNADDLNAFNSLKDQINSLYTEKDDVIRQIE